MGARDVAMVDGTPTKAPAKDSASHLDENNGNDGSSVAKGDMESHSFTDVLCLVIFLAFMAGMVYVLQYAVQHGDPRRLTHGFDWKGELCGVDQNVSDMPFLYYCGEDQERIDGFPTALNLKAPVCVTECPDSTQISMACLGSRTSQTSYMGTEPYITQQETITSVVSAQWSYPTRVLAGLYCVPDVPEGSAMANLTQDLLSSDGPLGNWMAKGAGAVGSVRRAPWPIAGSIVAAIVLGYLYLFLLNRMANVLVQATLGILCMGLFAVGCVCLGGFFLEKAGQDDALQSWEAKNPLYSEFDADTALLYSNIAGGIFMGLFFIFFCLICCCRDAINTAVGCVQAACECMFSMPSLLLQPVLEAGWKMLVAAVLLHGFTWVASSGEVTTSNIEYGDSELAGLRRHFTYDDNVKIMILYYIFGFFWLMEITNAISQFVISYCVALWYYTPVPKAGKVPMAPMVRGFFICIFYHLGTVAFGAFLIAVLRLTRIILNFIAEQSKKDGNQACACVASCLSCCVHCFEEMLKQINKNAYIDVCLSSNNFCTAAKNSFKFMASNAAEVMILNGACFIFSLAGVAFIAFFTGLSSFYLITSNERWTAQDSPNYVDSPEFVAFVCAMLGVAVATSFMVIFDHTADTLLYVYVWNKTHGHNTVQKYATGKLREITKYTPRSKPSSADSKPSSSSGHGLFSTFTSFFSSGHSAGAEETKPLMK